MFIMPGVISLIMVFSKQTKMAELYGIRDNEMGYYLAFALVIIPFSLIMDVFVLNTQEVGIIFCSHTFDRMISRSSRIHCSLTRKKATQAAGWLWG